jgi:hypothetical protein
LSACVQTCPQGFFALNRVCARCSDSCLTCSGSASSCLSCKDGFTYNPSTRTCTGSGQCLYGQRLQENGICVRICGLNSYFFNSGCVSECLPGYRPENGLACVQEISDTFCAPPLFRSGNSCVGTCPAGFYPNSANREC